MTKQTDADLKKDKIVIENYDHNWPIKAKQEIESIVHVINDPTITDIQHIGSTSIPQAMAKPIIDIYIAVSSIEWAKSQLVEPIVSLGYVYWAENPNKDKLFFVKGMPPYGDKRTHHVHVVRYDSPYWRDRLTFRDYLRSHPEEIEHYNQVKLSLAKEYPFDREAYTDGKNEYIKTILKKAGINQGGQR